MGRPKTGPLPKSVGFCLYPKKKLKAFTAMIFGDPQPYTEKELEYFAKGVVEKPKNEENIAWYLPGRDLQVMT